MLFLRGEEHFEEAVAIRAAGRHGSIAAGLVNDKDIARGRWRQARIDRTEFGQMRLPQTSNRAAGAV